MKEESFETGHLILTTFPPAKALALQHLNNRVNWRHEANADAHISSITRNQRKSIYEANYSSQKWLFLNQINYILRGRVIK